MYCCCCLVSQSSQSWQGKAHHRRRWKDASDRLAGLDSGIIFIAPDVYECSSQTSQIILYRLYFVIYNLFFSPLRKVPGPSLYAISNLPKAWRNSVLGKHWYEVLGLHEKYGDMVRIGPNEVSCVSPQAWNDIMGFKTGGRQVFGRDPEFMGLFQLGNDHFMSNDRSHHSFFRRLISPGFSERAMASQESIIMDWADKFINNLLQRTREPIDLVLTFHWATLDVMGDLTFGESFGCLENNKTSPWLALVMSSQEFIGIFHFVLSFPTTRLLYKLALRLPITQRWLQSVEFTYNKAKARLEKDAPDRKDILSLIWTDAQETKLAVSKEQVLSLATVLCLAGMETTSTTLSGVVFWVLSTPHAHEKLSREIRSFETEDDLSLKNLVSLPYLNACISEGLRLHTPIAGAVPRIVPEGGDWVSGTFLPGGVCRYGPYVANRRRYLC